MTPTFLTPPEAIDVAPGVQLYRHDALAVLPYLADGSVDCVATDPPYSSGGMVRGDRMQSTRAKYQSSDVVTEFANFTGDNRDQRSFGYWCTLWFAELIRVTRPGGMLCVFSDWRQLPTITDVIQCGGWVWRGIVPWDKVVARPMPDRFAAQAEYVVWATNGPREFNMRPGEAVYGEGVFKVRTPTDREHSTQKPVEVMEKLIRVACPIGGTVLDPFAGSGTTAEAALRLGRKAILCETNPTYADVIRRRIERIDCRAPGTLTRSLMDGAYDEITTEAVDAAS